MFGTTIYKKTDLQKDLKELFATSKYPLSYMWVAINQLKLSYLRLSKYIFKFVFYTTHEPFKHLN